MRTCGLISTYNHGCRCEACRRAAREARRRYRTRSRRYVPITCPLCLDTFENLGNHALVCR